MKHRKTFSWFPFKMRFKKMFEASHIVYLLLFCAVIVCRAYNSNLKHRFYGWSIT